MKTEFLYNFISNHKYAVLSTVSSEGLPEAALVDFAVAPDLRLIIDTIRTSRKFTNLTIMIRHSLRKPISFQTN
jgi:hypothetical protein